MPSRFLPGSRASGACRRAAAFLVSLLFFTPAPSHAADPVSPVAASAPTDLNTVTVVGQLNQTRDEIVPYLGATQYTLSRPEIQNQSQGADLPFNQLVLRAPGVAQDSFGQLHVRDEHANLQYRIDDVLVPEGISGFGQELDTRLIDHVSLITGSLPAQFGFRQSGIIDIHTKQGALEPGVVVSMYGGSYDRLQPSFEFGGSKGPFNYFVSGSYLHSNLGIENPTPGHTPIHDETDQYKGFADLQYVIDDSSRLTLLLSSTYSDFRIPNNPGQQPAFTLQGLTAFDSSTLDERQHEQNHYAILAYQKAFADVAFQWAAFARYSGVLFTPDRRGDLLFNGLSSRINRNLFTYGTQFDLSWTLTDQHTLRTGLLFDVESARADTVNQVFDVDASGAQSSDAPRTILDNSKKTGFVYGVYLQDEWKPWAPLTVNVGARFDIVDEYAHQGQLSPRVNVVLQATANTVLHAGYSRYFTPPPLELVATSSLGKFAGTTNEPAIRQSSPVKAERAHYFDAGVSQKAGGGLTLGLDAFYKVSRDLLDEGQFGPALIFSPFNYARGTQFGGEFTANYQKGGFNAYANLAYAYGVGTKVVSGEFEFDPDEFAYIRTHHVFLDHDQRLTGSFGISYTFKDTTLYADLLYGRGLRRGFANTERNPSYYPLNLGLTHDFKFGNRRTRGGTAAEGGKGGSGIRAGGSNSLPVGRGETVRLRLDVTNVFDQGYALRDGSGIGVGAPQYGARRALYAGLEWLF
ncbi:MAG TPA: TonB-dependent receptor [Chthoniobacterales bacterium]